MAILSSYGSDVLSDVPYSENTNYDMLNQISLIESQTAAVQDTNSSAQQDAMILSVFEQLSKQVNNCNKVNKGNLMVNESLSVELERYKERVKLLEERQNVDLSTREKLIIDDFEKEINSLKQTLSEQLKIKELLTKTFNVFKNESQEMEATNIDKKLLWKRKLRNWTILCVKWANDKITSTLKYKNVPDDAIKLMLFPFSLEGAARIWLEKEPPRSIHTWEDLVSKFVNYFFPPSKTTNLKNDITNL
ncbi:retrovirus-related pol polyprotein from transposon TNT 1-94 [Tanacetum coccineum]